MGRRYEVLSLMLGIPGTKGFGSDSYSTAGCGLYNILYMGGETGEITQELRSLSCT